MAGNYVSKVMKKVVKGHYKPGVVTHIHVYHDDWCAIFTGGECNCNPDVMEPQ